MKGRSCLSNLLETMDAVNDLLAEGGRWLNSADILNFDFSKAFDTLIVYHINVYYIMSIAGHKHERILLKSPLTAHDN